MATDVAVGVNWKEVTQKAANNVRRRVFEHIMDQNGGYMSQACSSAEILSMLYTRILNIGESTAPLVPLEFVARDEMGLPGPINGGEYNGPQTPEYDRLIFSPVHYSLVLYAMLIEVGRLSEDGLEHFNLDGSTVEMIGAEHSPGVETTTGSLSQGLSQAAGIAMARKMRGDAGKVWVMMSDGEFQEGQTWEAFQTAAFYKLDNLRVVVDVNGQQCDGAMDDVMTVEPLGDKLRAFGASVAEVSAHDLDALDEAMSRDADKPHVVLARSNPTQGLPLLNERAPFLHYLRFTSDEERARYQAALDEMKV